MNISSKEKMDILFPKEEYCSTEFIIDFFGGGVITTAGKMHVLRNDQNMQHYI